MTEHSPLLSADRGRSAVRALGFLRGMLAAGLGLGALTVLVLALWISAPAPDEGLGDTLRTAAGLWLLAHGAELVRSGTPTGVPAPVGVFPLLLTVVPVWLVHRAARDVLMPGEGRRAPSAAGAFVMVVGGYGLVGAAAAACVREGALSLYAPSSLLLPALVVAGAAASGVWTAAGRPFGPLPSWVPWSLSEWWARVRFAERVQAACRSAAAGAVVLLGGGALLVAAALVWHAQAARASFAQLSDGGVGQIAVLLLALALVPNAAVWGAAYGLGPGFALGTASTVTPLAFSGRPALPVFPLLAAVPDRGPGTAVNWAAGAVPVVAGLTVAWFTVQRAAPARCMREEAWSRRVTAQAAGLGAVGCGLLMAVLAAFAGGPLGTGALADFGPVWWLTGAAALAWTALLGVPGALLLRAWRLRGQARQEPAGGDRRWWKRSGRRGGEGDGDGVSEPSAGPGAVAVPASVRAAPAAPAAPPFPPAAGTGAAPAFPPIVGAASASRPDPRSDDSGSYDFLPTGPWKARTDPPREAGPSLNP
ncbi:DUF6350 family protein [Streptomyces sp. NPDC052052]|uniref:cell division protein PerM n=1 Tax=Streptomyces sp. NPDC052052 TaxID=3154756 RepID=UPI003444ECBD